MKTKIHHFVVSLLLIANCLLPIFTFAQPGSLDTTFSSDGKVTTPIGGTIDYGNSVAIQSDGKMVVAGYSFSGSYDNFALARYNTDGSLDTSFSSDGKVITAIGSDNAYGYSAAIQNNGKIVVAGYSSNGGNYDFAVVRYNTDGSLDTTFSTDGKVTTDFGGATDECYAVVIQSDGKIVLAGTSGSVSAYDFALARYNTDGSLDNSFDTDGILTTAIGSSNDIGKSVALQDDGKIVVAGYSYNGTDNDFAAVRYNTDGSLDTTFSTDGKVTTVLGSSDDKGNAVAIQSDGKIVVAGQSYGIQYVFALVRYNTDGSLDGTFDTDGKVTTTIGYDDAGYGMAIQNDGKIVVAGDSWNGLNNDFALARYNSNGSLDNSFDSDGKVTTAVGSQSDVVASVAIQSDDKIVAAGYSVSGSNRYFAVARYIGGNCPSTVSWTGLINTDWNNAGNWDSGKVPDICNPVMIPGTAIAPNQPVINTAGMKCKNIMINQSGGGNVTITGSGTLTVSD